MRACIFGRAGIVATLVMGLFGASACADETAKPVDTYGLGHILSSRLAGLDSFSIPITPIQLKNDIVYVADLYGDGLIRFAVKDVPIDDQPKIVSMRAISNIVGVSALGNIAQAASIRAENGLIMLEAPVVNEAVQSIPATTSSTTGIIVKLGFYAHPWVQPPRYVGKKNRLKALAIANSLAPPPLGPPPPGPQLGPSPPPPGPPPPH